MSCSPSAWRGVIKLQEVRTLVHASEHIAYVTDDASTDVSFRSTVIPGNAVAKNSNIYD
jgi:hypothetical protein